MTTTQRLAEWAWALRIADIPDSVVHAASRHMLDSVGTAVAAHRLNAAPFALPVAQRWPSDEATVLGAGAKVAAPMASFANGILIHALDFDDTHTGALVHPTAAVLPTALAVGEREGSSPAEVVAAAIIGLETVIRIGAAVRHGFHARGFHATPVCGVFAAALVAARLSGLSESEAVSAMGIAGSQAAGSLEFLNAGSSTKQFHPGWSGMSGVMAADLAAAGMSGPATILEGAYGLYRAYADQTVEPGSIVDDLGERWECTNITIKPYPVCQLSHTPLDAMTSLLDDISDPTGIKNIEVELPAESVPVVCEPRLIKLDPQSPYQAKFSLPWGLAALAIDGEIDISTFHDDRLDRPEVRALAAQVTHIATSGMVPPAEAPARVTVHMTDGTTLTAHATKSRGGPDLPLSDAEVFAKFTANCGPTVPTAALGAAILELGAVADLKSTLALTQVGEALQ